MNVPSPLGTAISSGLAKLHELQTVYGTEDLYVMLEVITVDNHNRKLAQNADNN